MTTFKSMDTAPRDGTIIEVMNSYGFRPTFALAQFIEDPHGGEFRGYPDSTRCWVSESNLSWRPYDGDPDSYIDPTGGAQNTFRYWGVDRDGRFDKEYTVFSNEKVITGAGTLIAPVKKRSWWQRLFRILR